MNKIRKIVSIFYQNNYLLEYFCNLMSYSKYLPIPPFEQDMTQCQSLSCRGGGGYLYLVFKFSTIFC